MKRKRLPGPAGPDFADAIRGTPAFSLRFENLAVTKMGNHALSKYFRPLAFAVQVQVSIFRHFIGLIDASEVFYLPSERTPVKAFTVAMIQRTTNPI